MGCMQSPPNKLGLVSFKRPRWVGPESQRGWPETHSLHFYQRKCSKSLLLNAEATGENAGMHRAKQRNLWFRRGGRARLVGLLLCAMQFHVKFGTKRSELSEPFHSWKFDKWVSDHPVWDSGPTRQDLSNETTPSLFGFDWIHPIDGIVE